MEAIYGVTLDLLAETLSKDGDLRAQYGEQQGRVEFERWLASKGLTWDQYAHAHNAWQERFRADPTGQLEAGFHMRMAQLSARTHFGDVRDMSADVAEGITLDTYAQLTVAISRAGANANEIVRKFGLRDMAHWQRANAAWTAKMGADTTYALSMQYGQLYQKYAGPSFQQEMVNQTAAILAEANAPKDVIDEPEEELTPELCRQKMASKSRNERWRYARRYAHMADLGNVPNKAEAIAIVTPLLLDIIELHDDETTSDAEDAARWLWDLGNRSDDFSGAVGRCLNRAREKLATLEAAFAPIQHKAVPERVFLRSKINDYQSLVETMTSYQNEDWSSGASAASPAFSAPFGMPLQPAAAPVIASSGGFPKWIFLLLIPIVIGAVFFANRARVGRARDAATSASVSASAHPLTPPEAATPDTKKGKRGK
ncbi:MAG: hypothetical protein FWD69_08690 [Polyangiaceae bacterium]|nr:hypothetical protein [Polyangiaceae bacterium]